MQQTEKVKIYKALGNGIRLSIIRELANAGEQGLRPSDLLDNIKIAFSTLSFHLNCLENATLIYSDKHRLNVYYHVNQKTVNELGIGSL